MIAAILNLLIAGVAWLLSSSSENESVMRRADGDVAGPSIVLIAMFCSGFAALVNEVAWTRVLSLVVGPTTYAFTLMLTSMITGIGLGAALGGRLCARRNITLAGLGWIE